LDLKENPLITPPNAVLNAGVPAILAYMKDVHQKDVIFLIDILIFIFIFLFLKRN